jgi:hypothetical protein
MYQIIGVPLSTVSPLMISEHLLLQDLITKSEEMDTMISLSQIIVDGQILPSLGKGYGTEVTYTKKVKVIKGNNPKDQGYD